MGYRSEVYLKASIELKEGFESQFTKESHYYDYIKSDEEYFYVYWSWVKWYHSYKEVKDIINWVNAERDEFYVGMIAVGEDNATEQYGDTSEVDMWTSAIVTGWMD